MMPAVLWPILAEVVPLTEFKPSASQVGFGGHTLPWLISLLILFAVVTVAFKKSRRTHLD